MDNRERISLRLHRDHVYIDAACFAAHFAGINAVALLRDAHDLLILPILSSEAGGYFVKQINLQGDRAIHAADFFRLNGIDETSECHIDAIWNRAVAGYRIENLFADRRVELQPESKLDSCISNA